MIVKRFLFIFFTILVFHQSSLATDTFGCSTGTVIYPDFSGTYYANCPIYCPADIPIYNLTNPIYIQTYGGDPECGIQSGSNIQGGFGSCKFGTGWGNLVKYVPVMNTCNVPLDDYIYVLIVPLSVVGFYIVRRRQSLLGSF